MSKTYGMVVALSTFEDRFEYLKLGGMVGSATFGSHRYLNQVLYTSKEWANIRRKVIIRDNACDLAFPDRIITDKILIHHLNPITIEDIVNRNPCIFDLNNLICVSANTHNAIHYGDKNLLTTTTYVERKKFDTCPWR